MEGKEDSVKHSVSQSSRAVGDWTLSLVGERPFVPCRMWGKAGPGTLKVEKRG